MWTKENTLTVVVSVAAALAAAVLYDKIVNPTSAPGAGEDAPILMAGGSLYIGSHEYHHFKPVSNTLVLYDATNTQVTDRYVDRVDVTDPTDVVTSYPPSTTSTPQNVTVNINYCNNDNTKCDSVTLAYAYTNGTGAFTISDVLSVDASKHPITRAHWALTNLLMHPRKNWQITGITVTTDSAVQTSCATGECSVVVHTCKIGGTSCSL